MKYQDWLTSLTTQQVRAFAFQSKVEGWRTNEADKLREQLLSNKTGKALFREHYGIEAEVQN